MVPRGRMVVLVSVVVLSLFAFSHAQLEPAVCYLRSAQEKSNFTLCTDNQATWCSGNQRYAATVIPMTDPDFPCTSPVAHCVEAPFSPSANTPTCIPDPSGDPKFSHCNYLQHSIPFELMTLSPNFTDLYPPMQYLALFSQDQFSVTDMFVEQTIYNKSISYTGIVGINVVSPTYFLNTAYIILVANTSTGQTFDVYVATLYDSFMLSPCISVPVQGIVEMQATFDNRTKSVWVMVRSADGKVTFYPLLSVGCPDTTNVLKWNLVSSDNSVDVTTVQSVKFVSQIEPDHTVDVSTGCFPPKTTRTLVSILTPNLVFIFGFAPSLATFDIQLNKSSVNVVYDVTVDSPNSVITAVETFGECFGNYLAPSQMLWLTVILQAPGANSTLKLISLNEFSLHPLECDASDAAWWLHPASYRANCVLVTLTCTNPTYFPVNSTACELRTESPQEPLNATAYGLAHRMQTAPYNQPVAALTSYTHLLFVDQDIFIQIFGFQEIVCDTTSPLNPLILDHFNTIQHGREVNNVHVSENGEHVFISYTKEKWEIDSNTRLLEICSILANNTVYNTTDPFLEAYSDTCDKLVPHAFTAFDYMIYYSQCSGGSECWRYGNYKNLSLENWGNSFVAYPDQSYFAIRPTTSFTCDPGFFCPGYGVRFKCSPGSICPEYGQSIPTPCPYNPDFDTTCAFQNLVQPVACPDGMVCVTPSATPIPTPPGYYISTGDRKTFYECSSGEWCSLQRFNVSVTGQPTDLTCAAGTSCIYPNVTEPTACKVMLNSSFIQINNYTEYCPAGTVYPAACPAGFYCPTPKEMTPCLSTYFCPNGSQQSNLCQAGYYCPTPAESYKCPSGYYCREGFIEPEKCHPLVVCPEGTQAEKMAISGILFDVGIILVLIAVYFAALKIRDRFRLKRDAKRILSPAPNRRDGGIQLKKKDFTIEFGFQDMGLELNGTKKKVLDGVTGKIRPGRVTAVMGPSGAGKTTFLTTLAGKASYGVRTGTVLINGEPADIETYKKVLGFVPQEDIMHRELTVKEIIRFNADVRLPKSLSEAQKTSITNEVITVLGLWDVRHQPIGDENTRGISGGQRKRVNIGMELVADPTVIFLDEPTSGLDSTSSEEVVSCLRKVADLGLTVVAVLHQPRYEIFQLFHDVLLLGKGGKTVYLGPSTEALAYFESIGFTCPEHTNPPDFFMDVISGRVLRNGHPDFAPTDLFGLWKTRDSDSTNSLYQTANTKGAPTGSRSVANYSQGVDMEAPLLRKTTTIEEDVDRKTAGFFRQLLIFTARALLQQTRDMKGFFMDNALIVIAGSLLGALYIDTPYKGPLSPQLAALCPPFMATACSLPQVDKLSAMASLISLSMSFTAITASLRCFGMEKVQYWRESASGINKVAYFLGKNIAQLVNILLAPIVFLSVFYTLTSPRATVGTYYVILFLLQFAFVGIGYFVSTILPYKNAQLAGVVIALVCAMFGGSSPTLKQLQQSPLTLIVSSISPDRWSQEALYISELDRYSSIYDITTSYQFYGFNIDNFQVDLAALLTIGIISRIVALLCLMFTNRDKMK